MHLHIYPAVYIQIYTYAHTHTHLYRKTKDLDERLRASLDLHTGVGSGQLLVQSERFWQTHVGRPSPNKQQATSHQAPLDPPSLHTSTIPPSLSHSPRTSGPGFPPRWPLSKTAHVNDYPFPGLLLRNLNSVTIASKPY